MTKAELYNQIETTVKEFYKEGGKIEINQLYVSIHQPNGEEYFFQEHEAYQLLEEVPEDINEEYWIIWESQGW